MRRFVAWLAINAVAGLQGDSETLLHTSPRVFCGPEADTLCEVDDNLVWEGASSLIQKSIHFITSDTSSNIPSSALQKDPARNLSGPSNRAAEIVPTNSTLQLAVPTNTSHVLASTNRRPRHHAHTSNPTMQTVEVVAFGTILLFVLITSLADAETQDMSKERKHSALYSMLSPHSHRATAIIFRLVIAVLVVISILILLAESDERIDKVFEWQFDTFEAVASWIFLIEYCLRLYVAPQRNRYRNIKAGQARLRWMFSFESIIDLAAIVPYFVEVVANQIWPGDEMQLPSLTWLRVFRLFRLLKVSFISESLDVFARVLYYNSEILLVSLILCLVLVLLLSVLLFAVAPKDDNSADYSSILACMYLAVMMLTGQGQPEGTMPWYTKIVVCITCIFAVGLFAIQASMLTWGFENEAERRIKKNFRIQKDKVKSILDGMDPNIDEGSSSSEDENEVDSDWEEYEENIAGDSEESESIDSEDEEAAEATSSRKFSEEEKRRMKILFSEKQCKYVRMIFYYLDSSEDGKIHQTELEDLEGINSREIFKVLDRDQSQAISKIEFIEWLATIKTKYDAVVFKMLLGDFLQACKARKERAQEIADDKAMPKEMIAVQKVFKDLQQENHRLKKQIERMQNSRRTPEPRRGSAPIRGFSTSALA